MKECTVVETRLKEAPFSFLSNLSWRTDISMMSETGQKIFRHELIHIRQKHSYDNLLTQLITCTFWINPFYWSIQEELNMIHEFIADAGSVDEGVTESFAYMLLKSYDEGQYLNPVHSFFHSPVKRRLDMVAATHKSSSGYIRKFTVLPVILFALMFSSIYVNKAGDDILEKLRVEK